METILDEDRASRKGLAERYMKDVEEAVADGLKMDGYEREKRIELRKACDDEGHANDYRPLLAGDGPEQWTLGVERLSKDARRK